MHKFAVLSLLIATRAFADDDARKIAEAGWKAYQKKDLGNAEKLTRKAIDIASMEDDVQAAALYNLGRILEDKKDKPGAIQAYKDSLALRHNGTVREQLRTLDASAAAAFDTFVPRPLKGPYAGIEGWCKDFITDARVAIENCTDPKLSPPRKPKSTVWKPAVPYQEVKLVQLYQGYAVILVKVNDKIYVAELHPYEDSGHCGEPTWKFDGVTQRGAVLDVAYEVAGMCTNREDAVNWSEHASMIIGIGSSKAPSGVEMRFELVETDLSGTSLNLIRKPTWSKDGTDRKSVV